MLSFFLTHFSLYEKISCTPIIVDYIENSYDEYVYITMDNMESFHDELKRSKRKRKEFSFGDGFYTCLIENEPSSYSEVILSLTHYFEKILLKLSLIPF